MLKAPKKPATVKLPVTPKPPTALYKAIQARLEAKDRETLHARTKKAVEAVEDLLEGVQPVEERTTQNPAPAVPSQIPWGLEGLVVDPDPKESIGKSGWFWDDGDHGVMRFGVGADPEDSCRKYESLEDCSWDHFAYIPNFPGTELLKHTAGYKAA